MTHSLTDYASRIRLQESSKLAINRKNGNDVTTFRHDVIVNFFDVLLFLLVNLVTGPSFKSISSLPLELRQFSFMRDWPEIRKSKIPTSELCPISGDWGKLGIPNLARIALIKYYWMLQNNKGTVFVVFELLREIQQGWG